jgi:hypothetical protein
MSAIKVYGLGEISPSNKQFLDTLQTLKHFTVEYEPNVQKFLTQPATIGPRIVFFDYTPESKQWITRIRSSNMPCYIAWLGRLFTKEDYQFAENNRVYAVFESPNYSDKNTQQKIQKLLLAFQSKEEISHLLHSFKSILVQSESELPKTVLQEIKTALSKLNKRVLGSEFEGVGESQTQSNEMPFHKNQTLTDVFTTMQDLERTGVLWVQGQLAGQKGQVDFLQGKIVSASCNETQGEKAIFRMYLWENLRFLFNRKEPNQFTQIEKMSKPLAALCKEGEEYNLRFQKIKKELPPPELRVDLEPKNLNENTKLTWNDFSTLASVVEFKLVAQVLNYNSLPDIAIFESLIRLRKENKIKVLVG